MCIEFAFAKEMSNCNMYSNYMLTVSDYTIYIYWNKYYMYMIQKAKQSYA